MVNRVFEVNSQHQTTSKRNARARIGKQISSVVPKTIDCSYLWECYWDISEIESWLSRKSTKKIKYVCCGHR